MTISINSTICKRFRLIFRIERVFENYFQKLLDWWQRRNDKRILILNVEKLILRFLRFVNKILIWIKVVARWRSIRKKLKIDDERLLLIVLSSILLIRLTIEFVDIVIVEFRIIEIVIVIKSLFDNQNHSYVFFNVQHVKKNRKCDIFRRFRNLKSKIKFHIVSNNNALMINWKIIDDSNVTKNILHVKSWRSIATSIDVRVRFCLKFFENDKNSLFESRDQINTLFFNDDFTKIFFLSQ